VLDPHLGGVSVLVWVAFARRRLEGRRVARLDEPRRRVQDLRELGEGEIVTKDDVAPVAGQHRAVVEAGRPLREERVVDVEDRVSVGVGRVEHGDPLDRHRALPLVERARLVHAEPLFERPNAAIDPGVPNRVKAVLRRERGALLGDEDLFVNGEREVADVDLDRRVADDQIARAAVVAVGVRARGIGDELIDVDEVGRVDRVCPSEVVVVTVQQKRRARERASGHVPPLFGVNLNFVPRDRAFPRLMGVHVEARDAVGGS
jgi:hypothetical protein